MKSLITSFTVLLCLITLNSSAQCEADHIVILSNFEFTPSELTIAPGETVAFINIEGEHTLNGITNSITDEPYNNLIDIFLEQTTGNVDGVCMGVVSFDTIGVFNFDCSVGYNAQAGMTLSITVDAFDLQELLLDMYSNQGQPVFESYYAFSIYCDSLLTQSGQWTLFVPNADAIDEIMAAMNLNQFDMLNIPNFEEILNYHFAEGRWLAEDLYDGLELPTAQGQSLNITQNGQETFVNGAQVVATDFEAYNGVIHVIDYCLAPQGSPESTVMEIIRNSDDHQIFENAIEAVGLDDELSAQAIINNDNDLPGPWTVFAPTDEAFTVLADEFGITTSDLLNSQFLSNIVNNHIVNYEIFAEDMLSGNVVNTLLGEQIQFDYIDSIFYVIGEQNTVEITIEDLHAFNGVVHVVNAVIQPFTPVLEGSCGIWRLELETTFAEEGWGDNYLYLEVNGNLVETITVFEGSSFRSYDFGVDSADQINIYFVPVNYVSGYLSYKLYNQDNQLIVQETQSNNSPVGSRVGITACQPLEEEYCGDITIKSYSDFGEGWLTASLDVFKNNQLVLEIPMPFGNLQTTKIASNYNDVFSFEYNSGGFIIEEIGYDVFDTDGQIVINQNIVNQTPESYADLLVCESIMGTYNCINGLCVDPMDGSGSFGSLNECQVDCEGLSLITENDEDFSIYPNPSFNIFNIEFFLESETEISVTTILGKQVYLETIKTLGNFNAQIDLSNHSKGIYNLIIKTPETVSNYKLVFQ